MEHDKLAVLHIDSERGWRGGQQQAAYLFERMVAKGHKTAMVCRKMSALEAYCREKDLPCYGIAMHGELDLIAGYKIAALCRKEKYRILHLHSSHALATGLWAKLFYPDLKLVAVRRVDFHIKKNLFSRFKYTTSRLDKIVCISHGIERVLNEDKIPEKKLLTIHSGVDLDKFKGTFNQNDLKRELGIPQDHLLVGTVAAMAGHKDYPNLLQAVKYIIERNNRISFCALGDGPDEKTIYELADSLGLGSRFVFAGFRNDVGRFLNCFDIFVLASYEEGLGTSILDAQALGLPVVACRTGGIPEIVIDGENGFLVPPRDSKALADAIEKLSTDHEMRIRFGLRAAETVRAFSIEQTVEKNIDLYRALLGEQG